MTDNQLELKSEFNGHVLALASIGLLRYGKLINWNDSETLDSVVNAITVTGDIYLIPLVNQSEAFKQGVDHLASFGDEGKDHFYEVVTATVGAMLQEFGGSLGIEQTRRATLEHGKIEAMKRLHGANMVLRQLGNDAEGDHAAAVMLDASGDIEAQLQRMDVPDDLKDKLRAIGEAAKTANGPTHEDEETAAKLRKGKRLN